MARCLIDQRTSNDNFVRLRDRFMVLRGGHFYQPANFEASSVEYKELKWIYRDPYWNVSNQKVLKVVQKLPQITI